MADRISLRLGRSDMNVLSTIDEPGRRPVVHVAGKHPAFSGISTSRFEKVILAFVMERDRLEEALAMLGALLKERGEHIGVLVVGGGSLLLLGVVERPTADVDVVGFSSPAGYAKGGALPEFLAVAVREVGDALGLGETWFNSGPAGLTDFGLPPGLEERVMVRIYGALEVHLPAREDLVCFKLYAAVDQGERSKHFTDLRALEPSREQFLNAARWTRTHDPSPGFMGELRRILGLLGIEVSDAEL